MWSKIFSLMIRSPHITGLEWRDRGRRAGPGAASQGQVKERRKVGEQQLVAVVRTEQFPHISHRTTNASLLSQCTVFALRLKSFEK